MVASFGRAGKNRNACDDLPPLARHGAVSCFLSWCTPPRGVSVLLAILSCKVAKRFPRGATESPFVRFFHGIMTEFPD